MTRPIYTDPTGQRAWIRGPYRTTTGTDPRTGQEVTIIYAIKEAASAIVERKPSKLVPLLAMGAVVLLGILLSDDDTERDAHA